MNRPFASILCSACLALAGAAAADEHPSSHEGGHGGGDYPTAVIERPLELPKGMFELQGNLTFGLNSSVATFGETLGSPFKPTYLGLGAAYGVDGHLQVAFSTQGLCLTGVSGGCEHVFDDFALEAAYGVLHQKGLEISLQGGLEFAGFAGDAGMAVAGAVGIDLKAVSGQFAVRAGPKLSFGLKERGDANREILKVPLEFIFQATPQLALSLASNITVLLDPGIGDLSDYYAIPLGVGALFAVDKHLDVGAQFAFINLFGKDGGVDGRIGQVFVAYRL
jgi:hypothetical protein